MKRITAADLRKKKGVSPVTMLSCYQARAAELVDDLVDAILVGDSLGMTLLGEDDTLNVPLSVMIACTRGIVRRTKRALVVCDLPFGTYEQSPEQAFETSVTILRETGCGAVKLEGGIAMAATVAFLTARGIPVMGHVGLQPQQARQLGGFVRMRDAERLHADAEALAQAGVFACVLECPAPGLAAGLCPQIAVPVIGIGTDDACDGRVAVLDDLIGLSGTPPAFAPRYAEVADAVRLAATHFTARSN